MKMPALAAALAAVTSIAPAFAETSFEPIKRRAGAEAFAAACARCHTPQEDGLGAGPPLDNILGRVSGSWPGFAYSDALAAAGFVWTEGALRAWMEDNTAFLPGSLMRHEGIADPVVQELILSYLRSISMGE